MFVQRVLAFPTAVYRVDLAGRKSQKVFTPAPGDTVVGAVTSGDSTAAMTAYGPRAPFDVVATKKNVYVQSPDGTPQITVTRPAVTTDDAMAGVSRAMIAPGAPTFLWYSRVGGSSNFDPAGRASGDIIEFGGGNHESARVRLPRDSAEKATDHVDAGDVVAALARPAAWNVCIAAIRWLRSEKTASSPVGGNPRSSSGCCPRFHR